LRMSVFGFKFLLFAFDRFAAEPIV